MKFILITLINLYQLVLSQPLNVLLGVQSSCRYPQTCSNYAKEMISVHGMRTGSVLAVRRFLSCQPFAKATVAQ